MYKLFNRVSSSKEREPPPLASHSPPSTFEEKFKLFNRGSSSKAAQEREPSFHGSSPASPIEETKFRLFGRSSSKVAQEPAYHASPPPVVEEKFRFFSRGSTASRLANHDKEPPPAPQVTEEKPKTPPFLSEEPEQPQILLPCPTCFRTFKVESLERHKGVCEKMATKKRKVFDSAKQRLEDLPEVVVGPPRTPMSPVLKRPSTSPVKKQPSWKENHLSLIRTVREAKASDMSRCPFCERNFNNKAYDRHVDWCKEQQSRIPKSPTHDTNEAKERWEARTKYRAPPLRRSIRSKYSPTRSLFSGAASPSASVDRLPDCSKSLSGSRASLDSRASSSAMSYQPQPTYSKNQGAYFGSHTLGRASGSAFVRQSSERRSLRAAPASPPPLRRSVEPPAPVPLTPINNNRTSALRASLRMKNAFAGLNSPYQMPQQSQPKTPIVSRYAQQNLAAPPVQQQQPQRRPTVLQLFSSAFNRPNGSSGVPSSPQPFTKPRVTPTLSNQGRRSEPEGVESKLMTASCYGNYSSPPSQSSLSNSKLKPPSRYSSPDSYNPYLSAEKQLAELFDDEYASKEKSRFSFSPKEPAPSSPAPKEDKTNMEQLERDLKSILSEINQLGKDKEKETPAKTAPARLQPPTKVSTLSFTMSVPRTPSTPRTPTSPATPMSPASPLGTKATTPDGEEKHLPKFCHSCGSPYPEKFQVKFCCQCGARRLYV